VWRTSRDAAALVEVAALPGPTGDTHVVAFSPDGDRLVAASNDGGVRGWQVRAGAIVADSMTSIARHTGVVTAIAFSPDGHWLASAGRDRTLTRTSMIDASSVSTTLPSAGTSLAIDEGGTIRAVTSAGSVERWDGSAPPVVDIDHGVRSGVTLGGDRHLALVLEDGAVFISAVGARTLDELRDRLARARADRP